MTEGLYDTVTKAYVDLVHRQGAQFGKEGKADGTVSILVMPCNEKTCQSQKR